MKALLRVERDNTKAEVPEFKVGDTVRVHVKVVEGDKVRTQVFQGTVIGRRGGGIRETFTVRKISGGIAVERLFPLHSPNVLLIERVREGRVRRAQLTYMKERKGKRARIAGRRLATELVSASEVLEAAKAAEEGRTEETEKLQKKAEKTKK
jgi:large subunit ribosomal protein L19